MILGLTFGIAGLLFIIWSFLHLIGMDIPSIWLIKAPFIFICVLFPIAVISDSWSDIKQIYHRIRFRQIQMKIPSDREDQP